MYFSIPSQLVPTWSLPKNYTTTLTKQQQNGGVIERGNANQINSTKHTYQFKAFIKSYADYVSVDNFFTQQGSKPFIYGGVTYSCGERLWRHEINLWVFEAQFEQVFT